MRLKNRVVFLVLALAVAVGVAVPAQPARASVSVSVGFFYDSLAPYGDWVTVGSYGRCWHPRHVAVGWQPYLDGEWVYTEDGWTWVSFDPWGGDPYHYGTWVDTADDGWIWIPGTVWAPAWVTWYITDDAFGWAPVPPSFAVGISGYVGPAVTVSRSAYVFVPARQFAGVNVSSVRVPVTQNATFIARSRPVTRFAVQGGALSAGGPPISQVERVAGKRIQRVSLAHAKTQAVPIRTSLQGKRASVVVPAGERAKLISEHEKRAPSQASRTMPSKSERAFQPPPVSHERHEKATVHQQPPPPSNEKNIKHERAATVHQPPSQPSHEKNVKHEQAATAHQPPPPPSHERHEKPVAQAQLNSVHQPPPAHVERQPNVQRVQPKPQGPPPAAKGNPPGKEKEKEHGKEN